MSLQTIAVTRGGETKHLTIGQAEDGNSRLYFDNAELHPVFEQGVRRFPKKFTVEFDEENGNGAVIKMQVDWRVNALLSASGKPIPNTGHVQPQVTNQADMLEFIARNLAILFSMANGEVEALEGFNGKKIFDPVTGEVIAYTPEQEQEPATGGYHSPVTSEATPV